jgi:hypothetical protein
MSLILMFFYWVMIPVAIFLMAKRLWQRSKSSLSKGVVLGVAAIIFVGLWWWAVGETWILDRQVRELCAKDGGVKVFETVPLPPELVGKYGGIRIPVKSMANPSDEYFYEIDTYYYLKGNPSMSRNRYRIIRRSDGKVLGEATSYGRGGGGLPGPWYGSSLTCPDPTKAKDIALLIFVKGENK